MARKFKVQGQEYNYIRIPNRVPLTITFTKHDIGTWNAGIEEYGTWIQASTKEEALFLLMTKYFGVKTQ